MQKKLFRSLVGVSLALVLVMSALITCGLYLFFTDQTRRTLREEAAALETLLAASDDPVKALQSGAISHRTTLISGDGAVLYDSGASAPGMENHLAREEIAKALDKGEGESRRESKTLGEEYLYYAALLPSGDVLRLAATQQSVTGLVGRMAGYVLLGAVIAVILASLAAKPITARLVAPINKLDLDEPMSNDVYEELSPVLRRLSQQKGRIAEQMDALRAQKGELDTIIAGMREGLIVLDEGRRVLSVNHSALHLLGAKESRFTLTELTRDEGLLALIDSAGAEGGAQGELTLASGVYRVSASEVLGSGTVVLFQDVTRQREAEDARKSFTANVSHELRTPLTSIGGYAELLKNGMVRQEDTASVGSRIYDESQRLLTLIEDILRLSKLDEGVTGERTVVALDELAKDSCEKLRERAKAADVNVQYSGESCEVFGDETLLSEMAYNLIDNAIKYNRQGGEVFAEVRRVGGAPILAVRDTGVGIPKESQPHVFERFYRVDKSRSKQTGGTGLGLSIVKHAAELSGARITLDSEEGQGTVITVCFPKDEQ